MLKLIPPRFAAITSGLLVAVTGFFALSQVPTSSFFPSARLQYGPQPRDFVRITEGAPFTVPPGRFFVLSSLGSAQSVPFSSVSITRNGAAVIGTTNEAYYGFPASIRPAPPLMAFQPGDLIDVQATAAGVDGRAWGYLSEATTSVPSGTWRPSLAFSPALQDVVLVREGNPYTVPPGMLCVITAIGTTTSPPMFGQAPVRLILNGQVEAEVNVYPGEFTHSSLVEQPPGFVFSSGSVLSVDAVDPTFTGEALGFLAAQ